jgi:hypothetical protein
MLRSLMNNFKLWLTNEQSSGCFHHLSMHSHVVYTANQLGLIFDQQESNPKPATALPYVFTPNQATYFLSFVCTKYDDLPYL